MTSVAVETPPHISVEHHIAELVGTHGADAKLHGVGFACVFNHNEIGVDKNNRQNPGGQHCDFLLGDKQQHQEYEREYGQQCQAGNDHLWVPCEEPVRAMGDDIAQFLAVGHRAEYGVQAHLFVHHAVVLGDHQVGISQTTVEQRVQVHRIPAYDKSHEKRRRQIPEQVQHVEPVMVRVQAGDRAAHRVDAVGKGQPRVQFAEEVRHHFNRIQAGGTGYLHNDQNYGDGFADMAECHGQCINNVDVDERTEDSGQDEQQRMLALDAEHQIADGGDDGLQESDGDQQQPAAKICLRSGDTANALAVDLKLVDGNQHETTYPQCQIRVERGDCGPVIVGGIHDFRGQSDGIAHELAESLVIQMQRIPDFLVSGGTIERGDIGAYGGDIAGHLAQRILRAIDGGFRLVQGIDKLVEQPVGLIQGAGQRSQRAIQRAVQGGETVQ